MPKNLLNKNREYLIGKALTEETCTNQILLSVINNFIFQYSKYLIFGGFFGRGNLTCQKVFANVNYVILKTARVVSIVLFFSTIRLEVCPLIGLRMTLSPDNKPKEMETASKFL